MRDQGERDQRERGRGRQRGSPTSPDVEEANFDYFIKVSASEEIQRLGATLAWNARRGEHQPILASGPGAINAAVDAVAVARRFVGQDDVPTELLCQPAFRDESKGSSLALFLSSSRVRKTNVDDSPAQFTVSKHSKPMVVAGALAARAREGIGPLMTAIGPEAVSNCMIAACWARVYLDDDGLDLHLVILTQKVEKTGGDGVTLHLPSTMIRVYVDEVE